MLYNINLEVEGGVEERLLRQRLARQLPEEGTTTTTTTTKTITTTYYYYYVY